QAARPQHGPALVILPKSPGRACGQFKPWRKASAAATGDTIPRARSAANQLGHMNHKKPTPVIGEPLGKVCPVCGRRSYSASGVHPQCAEHQADAPRCDRLKTQKKPKPAKVAPRSWDKKCPKCNNQVHVRLKVC